MIDKSIFNKLVVRVSQSRIHQDHYYITLSTRHSDAEQKEFCDIIESNFISFKKFKGSHYLVDWGSYVGKVGLF